VQERPRVQEGPMRTEPAYRSFNLATYRPFACRRMTRRLPRIGRSFLSIRWTKLSASRRVTRPASPRHRATCAGVAPGLPNALITAQTT
jgi:hypothetical protein